MCNQRSVIASGATVLGHLHHTVPARGWNHLGQVAVMLAIAAALRTLARRRLSRGANAD